MCLQVSLFLRQTLLSHGGYPLVEIPEGAAEAVDPLGPLGPLGPDAAADASAQHGHGRGHRLPGLASDHPSSLPDPTIPPRDSLTPLPDYYVALLHKHLMGTAVLRAESDARSVRFYAHCAAQAHAGSGGVSLAFVNLGQSANVTVALPPPLAAATIRVEYHLTAGRPIAAASSPLQSKEALLNGKLLALQPGPALPDLSGRTVSNGHPLVLPAASLGFVVFPGVEVPACK
jgi:hypothetical protein